MDKTGLRFDEITTDGRLWAVCYEGEDQNALQKAFEEWSDISFLEAFFEKNLEDLSSFFHITNLDVAIFDTIQDARTLECLILDIRPDMNLDEHFRPLENYRAREMTLSKEKMKGTATRRHPSWLRLYAIRFEKGRYLITGGAIKLTLKMEEREHTLKELDKMERVRNFLLENGAFDFEGFLDLTES